MSAAGGPAGRRRRIGVVVTVVVVVTAGCAAALILRPWQVSPTATGTGGVPDVVTARVELTTLTDQVRLNAQLDYGDPVDLPAAGGVVTALPAAGQVIEAGGAVYESDGRPVVLLQGERPLWRDLSSDVGDGQDVLQLEQNLSRFGFFDREPDTRFDWWTKNAIQQWQKSLGLEQTGTVSPADVVIANAPSIRVSQITGALGQSGVSPARYTETTLRAVARLTAAQARELQAGTPVTVQLPDGTELEATLAAIDPGGEPTGEDEQTTPPTATVEFPDQTQVAQAGPAAVRLLVSDTDRTAETLVVPVTALIATADGGYAVEILTGTAIVRVPVEIGMVADARAQILASGPDVDGAPADAPALAEGDDAVISR